jgi:hypothetical protein
MATFYCRKSGFRASRKTFARASGSVLGRLRFVENAAGTQRRPWLMKSRSCVELVQTCGFSVDAACRLFQLRDMKTTRFQTVIAVIVAVLVTAAGTLRADEMDDKYLQIYNLITQADQLGQRGRTDSATAKYAEAQRALLTFKRDYPAYNPKVVAYRLDYLQKQLTALAKAAAAPEPGLGSTPVLPANTEFKLLEPGGEPRQVLRLRAKAGEKQTVAMTIKMGMGMGPGEAKVEMVKLPAMQLTVGVTPTSVSKEGDVQYDLVIEEVDAVAEPGSPSEMVELMQGQLAIVKGLTVTRVTSDRGFSKRSELKLPPGAGGEVRKAMEGMQDSFASTEFLLPEEAVGVGARWEVKQKLKPGGMTLDQTVLYTLESLEGNVVTVKGNIVQQASAQKIANPMLPQAKADLVKLSGTGHATMTIDLERILPVQGTVASATELTLGLDAGGQKQPMHMKTDTKIQLESK